MKVMKGVLENRDKEIAELKKGKAATRESVPSKKGTKVVASSGKKVSKKKAVKKSKKKVKKSKK